ncbi:MAG TPA: HD domain-containing phosphohydrolase [Candidatus Obscuribacterales bacterium]
MSSDSKNQWRELTANLPAELASTLEEYAGRLLEKTIDALFYALERRDPLTAGHSIRVDKYCALIAGSMKLPQQNAKALHYAALLHDIGKMGVPEAVLYKSGRPTAEEHGLMQQHVKLTFEILKDLPFTPELSAVPFIASCHHEHLDGTGYYRGLRADQIPMAVRIFTFATVFDNLTSVRYLEERTPIVKVHELLQSRCERQLDPAVMDRFYKLPAHVVMQIMDSERRVVPSPVLDKYKGITWHRLIELCQGQLPDNGEENLAPQFEKMYAGPANLASLELS